MKDIRARFEEIWPVPEGVCWCIVDGGYFAESTEHIPNSIRHNARLDTFTRCQETTEIYLSIIDEMIVDMKLVEDFSPSNLRVIGIARESIGRAKQKIEMLK